MHRPSIFGKGPEIKMVLEGMMDDFREAFQLFDPEGTGSINESSFSTFIRAVGFCPSEKEIQELVLSLRRLKNRDAPIKDSCIIFEDVIAVITEKLKSNKDENDTSGSLF